MRSLTFLAKRSHRLWPPEWGGCSSVLREQGKLEEAIASCRQALAIKPDFAVAYNNLGLALLELGRLEEASNAVQKAVELAPQTPSSTRAWPK